MLYITTKNPLALWLLMAAACAACALVLVPSLSHADMSWEETIERSLIIGGQTQPLSTESTNVRLRQNVVALQEKTAGGIKYINMTNGECVLLSIHTKTFTRTTIAELHRRNMQGVSREIKFREGRLAQMESGQLGAVDEAQRERLKGELRQLELSQEPMEVQATEERETIEDHPCRKYVVTSKGENVAEIWVAEDITVDSWYSQYAHHAAEIDPANKRPWEMVPGFPLKAVYALGPIKQVITVKHLSTAEVPLSEFLLPEDAQPSDL